MQETDLFLNVPLLVLAVLLYIVVIFCIVFRNKILNHFHQRRVDALCTYLFQLEEKAQKAPVSEKFQIKDEMDLIRRQIKLLKGSYNRPILDNANDSKYGNENNVIELGRKSG